MKWEDYYQGYLDALTDYAWWKDGTQLVGSGARTLKEVTEEVIREMAFNTFFRASRNCVCSDCGKQYRDHSVPYLNFPTLHKLCDGKYVKL